MTPSGAHETLERTEFSVADETSADGTRSSDPTPPSEPHARIGRFVILRKVGHGGMGVVYAGYDDQLDRKVAIKLLRQRTRHAARRLAREAQALAKLSHPNVVQIYEAGQHQGSAFLAMEFVEGQTLGAWARAKPRTWRESVAVMLEAGRGLAAAHAKGLVHRDFKPDNVMIDDEGRVRVMDFGLVHGALAPDRDDDSLDSIDSSDSSDGEPDPERAANPQSIESTRSPTSRASQVASQRLTVTGSTMGTPAYMPPEQHSGLPTDARSDQFSFCVALWELLYGERPFAGNTLASLYLAVTGNTLREPPRELDVPTWLRKVVERGLSVDPAQRWPTMDALLLALSDNPVRRRRWLAGGALLVVATVAGVGLDRLWNERERAQIIEACEADGAVIEQAWNPEIVAGLAAGFVASEAPLAEQNWTRTYEQLDLYAFGWASLRAESCLGAKLEAKRTAEVQAQVEACLDDARLAFEATVEVLREPNPVLVAYAARLPPKLPSLDACLDPDTLARRSPVGETEQVDQLRATLQRAIALELVGSYTEALTLTEQVATDAAALADLALEAEARLLAGEIHEALADYPAARRELERAFRLGGEARADEVALRAASKLVFVIGVKIGEHAVARSWAEFGAMLLARLDERGVDAAGYYTNLASLERVAGDYAAALASANRAVALYEATLGEHHPELAQALLVAASIHRIRDEFDQSLAVAERALAVREAAYGPYHPDVADTLEAIAGTHDARGEFEPSRKLNQRALEIRERAFGPDHIDVSASLSALAILDVYAGRDAEALATLERVLAIRERALGPDHDRVGAVLDNLSIIHFRLGHPEQAAALNRRAMIINEKVYGPEHPRVAGNLTNLTQILLDQKRYDEAEQTATRAMQIYIAEFGEDHSDVANAIAGVGSVREARGDLRGALADYQRALAIFERALGPDHYDLSDVLWMIGAAHRSLGELELARASFERSLALELAAGGGGSRTGETRLDLADLCWELGDRKAARAYAEAAEADLRAVESPPELLAALDEWLANH